MQSMFSVQLNLVENLCISKKAKDNILARNALKLFDSKEGCDMVFEIAQGKNHFGL